jgi:hypothetical protein
MSKSKEAPSIIPDEEDQNVYLVVDDFGYIGRCWRETNVNATDLETVITDLLEGQYNEPVRLVGFNTAEGWARDVSELVADEIRRRCDSADDRGSHPPSGLSRAARESRPSPNDVAARLNYWRSRIGTRNLARGYRDTLERDGRLLAPRLTQAVSGPFYGPLWLQAWAYVASGSRSLCDACESGLATPARSAAKPPALFRWGTICFPLSFIRPLPVLFVAVHAG